MIRPPSFSWNPYNCARLTEMWNNSSLTAKQIAFVLQCTKNAVVGKAHRLYLNPRPSPIIRGVSKKPKIEAKPMQPRTPTKSNLVTTNALLGNTHHVVRNSWPSSEDCLHPKCRCHAVPYHLFCYEHAYMKGLLMSEGLLRKLA